MNTNDKRIMQVKEKIAKKRELLGKSKRFSPITNCALTLHNTLYNLNVIKEETLIALLVELSCYADKALELGYEYKVAGFCVDDWLEDIQMRLANLNHRQETQKLQVMEKRLEQLLSEDKRTELELDTISELLEI